MLMRKHKRFLLNSLLTLIISAGCWCWVLTPNAEEVTRLALGSDRVLLSSTGEHLQTLRTDFKKRRLEWYELDHFPKVLQDAVIMAEDQRFAFHFGFDPFGLTRAFIANISGRRIQGASTITMQLSDLIRKEVLLHNSSIKKGSFSHKLAQIFRAFFIELKWSKSEILEAYLNLIHLRGEFQGVPALTYAYLKKDPLALNLPEAAVIAAMISSPNQNLDTLKKRACTLYKRIDSIDSFCVHIESAIQSFAGKPSMPTNAHFAPHLASRAFEEFPDFTVIKSTLDSVLQKKVINILEKNIYRLKNSNVRDSAAIVIENKTGNVLAYVGTISTSENPYVDGVKSYRQAGSSLKPFIYAKALASKTLTAASILLDDPTAISWNGDIYRPSNYDKHFYGNVTVREALASSLNVPAVKTVTIIGLHETYNVLKSIQLSNLKQPDFYGVSMALGAVEVRLDELANAYRILANGGLWSPLRFTDKDVNKIDSGKRTFSPEASYIISSILSDPNARAIGFGWDTPLETPFWTAVKTGTSKDYRDNWCVGYSERYTVAVWAGNFNSEAMEKVSGVSGAGPSWFEIMSELHNQERSLPPTPPDTVVVKNVRHSFTSQAHKEYFVSGTEPSQDLIEPAMEKRVQFVFPAEGSTLVKDPHMDQENVALFIRFKGTVPPKSELYWNGKSIGEAVSPFKVDRPIVGEHELKVVANGGKVLSSVHFTIRGAK